MTTNLNPTKGLANGTDLTLHSLTFFNQRELDLVSQKVSSALPGEVIEVPLPFSVNVLAKIRSSEGTFLQEIPILLNERQTYVKFANASVPIKSFPIELGFSYTFHKIQGKTLNRIILCINSQSLPKVGFHEFLVGFSV